MESVQIFFVFSKVNVNSQWISDQPCIIGSVWLWNLFIGGSKLDDFLPICNDINMNRTFKSAKIWLRNSIFNVSKFFTYVSKTHANLSTYSRKPGNYNGIIIFEIDIMRKSSPINLKFIFLPLSKPNWRFFSGAVSWCSQ